jgi:hypothetical protein
MHMLDMPHQIQLHFTYVSRPCKPFIAPGPFTNSETSASPAWQKEEKGLKARAIRARGVEPRFASNKWGFFHKARGGVPSDSSYYQKPQIKLVSDN